MVRFRTRRLNLIQGFLLALAAVLLVQFPGSPLIVNSQSAATTSAQDTLQKPLDESITIRRDTQTGEEQWRGEKEKLTLTLEELEQTLAQLTTRRQELLKSVAGLEKRVADKEQQLADIDAIRTSISPLIDQLIGELDAFVAEDLPFLPEERSARLARLHELRTDPEVTVSEQFRKVLEAMLVESEYGTTIEVYQQTLSLNPLNSNTPETSRSDTLVDVFRLGRTSLFYKTLDGKGCGYYNVATKSWQPLPQEYNRAIAAAVEIGAKRRPVELLTLPLGRMQVQ